MKIIYTNDRIELQVSDEDYALLNRHVWCMDGQYPCTRVGGLKLRMHQLVCPSGLGTVTDHKNRLKTDNRRENLRLITRAENSYNSTKRNGRKFIGVYRHTRDNYVYGQVKHEGITYTMPKALNEIDAAQMRDYVCWKIRREFAVYNFPEIDYSQFEHSYKDQIDSKVNYLWNK